MTQYAIASETVWPSANDVAASTGDGKTGKELKLSPWRKAGMRNFVISGFKVPISSANLDLSVPSGEAFINGYHVIVPGSNTITTTNGTNYLYLALTRDGGGKVNGAVFDRLSSPFDHADYLLIADLRATAGVLTDTIDCRLITPVPGPYSGPVNVYPASSPMLSPEGNMLLTGTTGLSGIHIYNAFRLKAGVQLNALGGLMVLMATTVIEIAGTINGRSFAGAAGSGGLSPGNGGAGTDSAGGGGGGEGAASGGAGGAMILNGFTEVGGGTAGAPGGGSGGSPSTPSGTFAMRAWSLLTSLRGGAGGGGGRGTGGGNGGAGSSTVVLWAPMVILRSTASIDLRGGAGNNATGSPDQGGGGGGGGGSLFVVCRHGWWIDEGGSVSTGGGIPGSGIGAGGNGGNGGSGAMQVMAF